MYKSELLSAKFYLAALAFISTLTIPLTTVAHCQIPCGIYDDHARLQSMLEDAATIKKATTLLAELTDKTEPQSANQTTRWIFNKETHAQNIIATISDYFLTQRVKPSQVDYTERLVKHVKHHSVIIAAMKAKQNAASTFADALIERIEALEVYYPVPEHTH